MVDTLYHQLYPHPLLRQTIELGRYCISMHTASHNVKISINVTTNYFTCQSKGYSFGAL